MINLLSSATKTAPRRLDKEPSVEYGAQQDQRRYNPNCHRQLAGPHPFTYRTPISSMLCALLLRRL
jgi:hypothetical protein